MSTNTQEPIKEKKSKWKLSSLRHNDKVSNDTAKIENETFAVPSGVAPTLGPSSINLNPSHETVTDDSTYGSSTRDSEASGTFPTISNQQAQDQNAPLHTRTDKTTGRTIVTTTTTTTTTVTTVDGDHVEVPAGQEVRVTETTKETVPIELSAQPVTPGIQHQADPLASVSKPKVRAPSPQPPSTAAVIERYGGAPATTGSDSPVSPIRPTVSHNNFSYPARPPGSQNSTPPFPPAATGGAQDSYQPYRAANPTNPGEMMQQTVRQPQRPYYDDVPHDDHHQNQHISFQQPGEQPGHPGYNHAPGGVPQPLSHQPSISHPLSHQPSLNQPLAHQPSISQTPVHQPGYNPANQFASPPNHGLPHQQSQFGHQQPQFGHQQRQLGHQPSQLGHQSSQLGQQSQQQQQQKMGTLAGLKAAAAGIHGAGETLRGTLNSSIERRTHGDPSRVAAQEAIAQHGMQEIQTGRFYHAGRDDATATPVVGTTGPVSPLASHPQQQGGPAGQRYDPLETNLVAEEVGVGEKKKGGLRNVLRRKEVPGR